MLFLLGIYVTQALIYNCSLTNDDCTDIHKPVCGLNMSNYAIQTFPNLCYACKSNTITKYILGACRDKDLNSQFPIDTTHYAPLNPQNTTFTHISKCIDPRPSICGSISQLTCGILDNTCSGSNCLQEFLNECVACQNLLIDSYFLGNCSDYNQLPQTPQIIQCSSVQSCSIQEQADVCGFLDKNAICQNPPCLQPFTNKCSACEQQNITSFFHGQCSQYQQIFGEQDQQTKYYVQNYQYCLPNRPIDCNKEYKQTCGVLKQCFGNNCERIFDNICQACSNTNIEGYYLGECLHNLGILINFYLFIIYVITI